MYLFRRLSYRTQQTSNQPPASKPALPKEQVSFSYNFLCGVNVAADIFPTAHTNRFSQKLLNPTA
jgi:hypothetical protein